MNLGQLCHCCGRLCLIEDLDGKDDGSGDYNILECEDCYNLVGPYWFPRWIRRFLQILLSRPPQWRPGPPKDIS